MSDLAIEQASARANQRRFPPLVLHARPGGAAVAGGWMLTFLVGLALFGLLLLAPRQSEIFAAGLAPSLDGGHWFGVDVAGRDVLARVLAGLGVTLLLGVGASLIALALGLVWGAAGFVGGPIGAATARVADAIGGLPLAYFAVGLLMVVRFDDLAANLLFVCFTVGAIGSLSLAGAAREHAAWLRRQPFIDAARAAGAKSRWLLDRHLAPNALAPMLGGAVRAAPALVAGESLLSFIGVGAQVPSLGRLISEGAEQVQAAPWAAVAPATTLFALLLALRLLGAERREASAAGAHSARRTRIAGPPASTDIR